jgi:sugar phosphate permease
MAALIALAMPRANPQAVIRTEILNERGQQAGWRDVMRLRTSWLLFFAYMAFNMAFWGYLGWMPSYLSLARHIDLKHLGLAASIPYLFGFLGMLAFGWLGNRPLYRHRALLVGAAYVLAGIGLFAAFRAATPGGSIAGLSMAAFFLYGGFGPVWGIALDLTPETARGAFSGFVNCGGQIGGIFAPIVVGLIVSHTGAFTDGFVFMIAVLVISALCFTALHPILRRRQRVVEGVA